MAERSDMELTDGYEKRRLQEVQKYAFLERQVNHSSDDLVGLATSIFGTKTALITMVEQDRQWFEARIGFDRCETSRDASFCAHALVSEDVLVVLDAKKDPRFLSNSLVTGEPFIRFYAGAPLVTPRGYVIGTLCIIDDMPRESFSLDDCKRLQSLARLAMDQFELKRLTEAQKAALCLSRTIADGILNVTLPDSITHSNAAASKILGYDRQEFLDLSLSDLIPTELSRKVEAASKRFAKSNREYASVGAVEATVKTKSGQEAPIEFSAGIWRSDGTLMMGIILRDIAERKRREASFQMLFERNPLPMWIIDAKSYAFVSINDAVCDLYGLPAETMLKRTLLDIRLPEDRAGVSQFLTRIGDAYEAPEPVTHMTFDGKRIRVLPYARRIQYGGKECILSVIIDVTERERASIELKSTRIFLNAIVESIPSMLFVKDVEDGRFVLINKAGEELLGLDRADIIGKTDFDFFSQEDAERFTAADQAVVAGEELVVIENEPVLTRKGIRSLRTQKVGVPDASGKPRYLLGVSEDVTERLAMEEHNRHLSRHDILTGLPNRLAFQDLLASNLSIPEQSASGFALYLIDLDRFKAVNDSLGHHAGDELLRQVATRLSVVKAEGDTVARLGGDEFAVIHRCCGSAEQAQRFAQQIESAFAAPFLVDGQQIAMGCSVGVALYPKDGSHADALLKRADLALYAAKEASECSYAFFNPALEERADRDRLLRDELRFALDKSQLHVVYQPIVDAQTHRTVCCEALLRWHHPELGPVSPVEFIPAAEAAGLIPAIGRWVLQQACSEAACWPSDVRVAVNLSPLQFTGFTLARDVAWALSNSGLSPDRLELEITEGIFLRDSDDNIDTLRQLKTLGVRIALDDFGTGYSSLSYLRSFAFDKIKIDRAFITGLPSSADSLSIVRAVIGLGRSFRATITAEGVETSEQVEVLAREGCDQCQGYMFSKPIEARAVHLRIAHEKGQEAVTA
uniref:EAL domain-containing protein n=2 Tax=Agrobacterium rosae TaxID=1972867 RepID=A0ABU4W6K0_9HYPH|nr:EAL domain-containing protein [Agrobacterium rosae]MDX8332909.1 EAL domain-containing protein [Agrobacterium rosae]